MRLVDRHPGTAARNGGGSPSAHLRFRAGGQLVELRPGKTTIGSSPRCDLQIEHPGIAPVHCLIVRNEGQLSVRRWAIDTRLNGAPFDEAPFVEGDFLKLGEVELELVGMSPTDEINERIESSLRQADLAESACNEWMASESLPAGGREYLTAEISGFSASGETALPISEVATAVNAENPAACLVGDSPLRIEAAEFVFRELQTACRIARGRSRKLLASLREARKNNVELTNQLAFTRDELVELTREQLDRRQTSREWPEWQDEWEAEVQALRREIVELEGRLADHVCSMSELQSQLANVTAIAPQVLKLSGVGCGCEDQSVSTPVSRIEDAAEVGAAKNEGLRFSIPRADESHTRNGDLNGASEEAAESTNGSCGRAASQKMPVENGLHCDSDSQELEVEVPAWVAREVATETAQPESNVSPFDDPSIWKTGATGPSDDFGVMPTTAASAESDPSALWQGATEGDEVTADVISQKSSLEAANLWQPTGVEVADPVAEEGTSTSAKLPPTSYIERFAHMFADETAGEAPADAPPSEMATDEMLTKPQSLGSIRNAALISTPASGDEEESIEEYMAKLLQRVRGDSPAAAVPMPEPPVGVIEEPPVTPCPESSASLESVPVGAAISTNVGLADEDEEIPVNWEAFARRAATPVADLGPMRALANETARRAISRHALKKHRRDAVTKVIVSALAGMTSLWLMLDAPSWHHVQFIAACVSLLVAAYWAGEAGRAMIESFRAAAYDGPSEEDGRSETDEESALPIDLDAVR